MDKLCGIGTSTQTRLEGKRKRIHREALKRRELQTLKIAVEMMEFVKMKLIDLCRERNSFQTRGGLRTTLNEKV